jgi:hypothetical protein
LRHIDNAGMGDTGCVQAQKVGILREHHTAFPRGKFEMPGILGLYCPT